MPETPKTRRPKGSGSGWQLPDGRWAWQQTVPPLPGDTAQRPRITRYGKTAAAARKAVAAAIAARERQAQAGASLTVAAFLEQWLRDVVRPRRRPRTIEGYEGAIRRYIAPALGATRLRDLKPADLQRLYAALQTAGLHGTAALVHTILHAAFRQAVRWELLDRNPADRVDHPRPQPKPRQALTRAEAGRLIAALVDHPEEALYLVALTTGMRAGELLGLRWASVDWAAGTVHVHEQIQWLAGQPTPGPPKSRSRLAPLPPFALAALRRHQERQAFARQAAGSAWQEHGLVFPCDDGTPQRRQNWLNRWRQVTARLDMPPYSLHDLRRSFATLARAAGSQLETVQHTMGHATLTMLLGVYREVQPEDRATMRDQLEAFLAPVEPSDDADSGG